MAESSEKRPDNATDAKTEPPIDIEAKGHDEESPTPPYSVYANWERWCIVLMAALAALFRFVSPIEVQQISDDD